MGSLWGFQLPLKSDYRNRRHDLASKLNDQPLNLQ
jgi:hypothetical protein